MASYYILRGIHYLNQQLLESKQPVNLGWPWQLPPVLGNTVIWAEGRALGSAHWAELLWLLPFLQRHLVGSAHWRSAGIGCSGQYCEHRSGLLEDSGLPVGVQVPGMGFC